MTEIRNRTWDWLSQLFVWDTSEKQRMARAAMAAGLGLPSEVYARPFPGSTTTLSVSTPAPAPSQRGWLGKAALAAALLACGVGMGALAVGLLQRPPVTENTSPSAADPGPQEFDIRWEMRDGKVHFDPAQRIK